MPELFEAPSHVILLVILIRITTEKKFLTHQLIKQKLVIKIFFGNCLEHNYNDKVSSTFKQ